MNALNRTIFEGRLVAFRRGRDYRHCAPQWPDYVAPKTSMSKDWHSQLKGPALERWISDLATWWKTFNAPLLLSRLIADLEPELKKALARARGPRRRGVARPISSHSTPRFCHAEPYQQRHGAGKTSDLTLRASCAGRSISSRHRRSVEAATGDLQASQEDLRNVLVSLLAEVALNYVEVRSFQTRLVAAEANLESQSETYQLTKWRYKAGLSDELSAAATTLSGVPNTNLAHGVGGGHEPHCRAPGRTTGQAPLATGETRAYSDRAPGGCRGRAG
jgi:outer membrane protein TolC